MPTWPASLPQAPLVDQWSGGPQRNKVSFQPEIGPSIDRRRGSSAFHTYQATFAPLTDAQLATFVYFFETELYDGVVSFQWNDPVTGAAYNWKFSDDEPPYQVTSGEGNLHSLTFNLLRLGTV